MTQHIHIAGEANDAREVALGEALFDLSALLLSSGFLADPANHAAYEKVVAAFNLSTQVDEAPGREINYEGRLRIAAWNVLRAREMDTDAIYAIIKNIAAEFNRLAALVPHPVPVGEKDD